MILQDWLYCIKDLFGQFCTPVIVLRKIIRART